MKRPKLNDLWSSQGISHEEIVARIAERTDKECLAGFALFIEETDMPAEIVVCIAELAAMDRCTATVLRGLEPVIRAKVSEGIMPEVFELFVLMIEAMVRKAKKVFAINPENN